MGRPSHTRALGIWMNGVRVGTWHFKNGKSELTYDRDWVSSEAGRPLSLSLPMPMDDISLKGDAVGNYFDNLLPDSQPIRQRLHSRFVTKSEGAFDLLTAIGRDCVGAVQLLPIDQPPPDIKTIDAKPLTESEIARCLRGVITPPKSGLRNPDDDDDYFRISIAGAQEKSAFTWHHEKWSHPCGATPTTHIFKLPLGLVGNRRADMRTSIENEWLCAELLYEYGLPVARSQIEQFEDQKVLIVPRFDRRISQNGGYWLRLPQEDFCQALGRHSSQKYESDGGPGILDIANILQTSENVEQDLKTILQAQIVFWLLAATDGHAKNFSIQILPRGRFKLTPLYDVLSAWPVIGAGPEQLDYQKLKLAMAVRGKSPHYRLRDIQYRHFIETAQRCGYSGNHAQLVDEVITVTSTAIHNVGSRLPTNFPYEIFEKITQGMLSCAARLTRERQISLQNLSTS